MEKSWRTELAAQIFEEKHVRKRNQRRVRLEGRTPDVFISGGLAPFAATLRRSNEITEIERSSELGTMTYRGVPLTVFDEDLFLAILSTRRGQKEDAHPRDEEDELTTYARCVFETSYSELLRFMGIGWNGKSLALIKKRLDALMMGVMSIRWKEPEDVWRNRKFHLVDAIYDDEADNRLRIRLSLDVLLLYEIRNEYQGYLEDRSKVRSAATKRVITYLHHLKHFRQKGEHRESLKRLAEKINWTLPERADNRKRDLKTMARELKEAGISMGIDDKNGMLVFMKG